MRRDLRFLQLPRESREGRGGVIYPGALLFVPHALRLGAEKWVERHPQRVQRDRKALEARLQQVEAQPRMLLLWHLQVSLIGRDGGGVRPRMEFSRGQHGDDGDVLFL